MKRILFILISSLLLLLVLPAQAQSYQSIFVTSQRYDRGQMIWRSDHGTIFILTNSGEVVRFPVSTYGPLPQNPFRIAPLGKVPPMMGFGKVWANYDDVRAKLGWATINEVGRNSLMVEHANGSIYMQDLAARLLRVKPDNSWEYVDSIPVPDPNEERPAIKSVTVSSDPVAPGDQLTVTWDIANVDDAIIEFYDAYPRNDILYAINSEQPSSGSLTFTVPDSVLHGLTVTVHGVHYRNLSDGRLVTARVVSETLNIGLRDDTPQEPDAIETWAVYQAYENGMMIWRRDTGNILVLYNDGSIGSYPLTYYAYLSDAPRDLDVPDGMVLPVNGFGRVWAYLDNVREKLGWATDTETGYDLTITTIDHHLLEYNIPPDGKIYITPQDWRY